MANLQPHRTRFVPGTPQRRPSCSQANGHRAAPVFLGAVVGSVSHTFWPSFGVRSPVSDRMVEVVGRDERWTSQAL
jgi:hypothetical protein